MRRALSLGAAAALLALSACSSTNEGVVYVERPPEAIYASAVEALEAGDYQRAADEFDEVERQHPYSPLATDAQLLSAFAHYEALRYDEAITGLERFIELHPGHEDIAYAYYLRGLSYYEQIVDVERDQQITEQALQTLGEVATRFPNTDYGRDARLKIDLALDQLAGREMSVGRYYLRQGHPQAAINRFNVVVQQFETTSHVPEALHRLTEAYLSLGLEEEAQRNAAVLGHNYPGSEWYQDSYALLVEGAPRERPRNAFQRAIDQIF